MSVETWRFRAVLALAKGHGVRVTLMDPGDSDIIRGLGGRFDYNSDSHHRWETGWNDDLAAACYRRVVWADTCDDSEYRSSVDRFEPGWRWEGLLHEVAHAATATRPGSGPGDELATVAWEFLVAARVFGLLSEESKRVGWSRRQAFDTGMRKDRDKIRAIIAEDTGYARRMVSEEAIASARFSAEWDRQHDPCLPVIMP